MPTLQEILAAKKLAQAKATATATTTAPIPNTPANTPANTSKVVPGTAVVAGQASSESTIAPAVKEESKTAVAVSIAEPKKDAKPVSTPSEPTPVPQFARNLAEELHSMAQEQDWLDVEQSANSLNEILSVIFDLPYPPDVFIDECIDNAACALEAQKNRYLHDVLNGKKQSGKRQKASADMSPLQQAIELDKLGDDDIFVFDPLAGIGG